MDGIIPAYAGQMFYQGFESLIPWDHPRIRGTNGVERKRLYCFGGSSPHTRDKCHSKKFNTDYFRIIPAYAGQMSVYK